MDEKESLRKKILVRQRQEELMKEESNRWIGKGLMIREEADVESSKTEFDPVIDHSRHDRTKWDTESNHHHLSQITEVPTPESISHNQPSDLPLFSPIEHRSKIGSPTHSPNTRPDFTKLGSYKKESFKEDAPDYQTFRATQEPQELSASEIEQTDRDRDTGYGPLRTPERASVRKEEDRDHNIMRSPLSKQNMSSPILF